MTVSAYEVHVLKRLRHARVQAACSMPGSGNPSIGLEYVHPDPCQGCERIERLVAQAEAAARAEERTSVLARLTEDDVVEAALREFGKPDEIRLSVRIAFAEARAYLSRPKPDDVPLYKDPGRIRKGPQR